MRPFTEAADVAGFHAARGILTSEGGKASHAALVARGMGRPCVCGASELEIDLEAGEMHVNGTVLREGDLIAIDGSSGAVTVEDVPLVPAEVDEYFQAVLGWSDELRRLEVRANADRPVDAKAAHRFGAQGIGLCRTEHMFLGDDRQAKMQAMIMAAEEAERRAALAELEPLQRADFEGLFAEMAGLPVTIRLLDPPLHEFLPHADDLAAEIERRLAAPGREPVDATGARAAPGAPAGGDEPDAGHARLPAGAALPGDLRDAGAGDRRRRGGGARAGRGRAASWRS